jgi:three-Cys-motif partner protein
MVTKNKSWGGNWTEKKLDAFEKYVNAYLLIMNKYRQNYFWKLIYFDAFAGSGTRESNEEFEENDNNLFGLKLNEISLYKGAAERVLNISQEGFDYYYFIDKSNEAANKLENRLQSLANGKKLIFRPGEANEQIQALATAMQRDKSLTTLALLDPFGMQINWNSIELLKNTRTDLWILIPTGVIVNRLLDRKGELTHIEKLTSFFGVSENEIRDYFYQKESIITLFGEETITKKCKQSIKKITEFYISRLKTIFKEVTEQPLELLNTKGVPIYHFAFASNNATAKKIAKQIIGDK